MALRYLAGACTSPTFTDIPGEPLLGEHVERQLSAAFARALLALHPRQVPQLHDNPNSAHHVNAAEPSK
eukprot:6864391-Pyramimonas_sp.AAC.1